MPKVPPEEYYSIREVANQLRVDYQVIRVLILDGHMKAVKVGKQWRISQANLDRYLHTHSTQLISNL